MTLAALSTINQDDVDHVEDDGDVSNQQGAADERYSAEEFADLQREQKRSGNAGDPLGPGTFSPEAITFGKAK